MEKKQVLIVHGGDVFDTEEDYLNFLREYKVSSLDYYFRTTWKHSLQKKLGNDYFVIQPRMPNKYRAQYVAWKIWFDKIIPFLNDDLILIGSSLGGLFLVKYLAENKLSVKIEKLILVAAPFQVGHSAEKYGDFGAPAEYNLLHEQCKKIYLYHSKDDKVVPFSEFESYQEIFPDATIRIFEDKGHFQVKEFPEIVEDITE